MVCNSKRNSCLKNKNIVRDSTHSFNNIQLEFKKSFWKLLTCAPTWKLMAKHDSTGVWNQTYQLFNILTSISLENVECCLKSIIDFFLTLASIIYEGLNQCYIISTKQLLTLNLNKQYNNLKRLAYFSSSSLYNTAVTGF